MLDCYKEVNGKKMFLNCITVQTKHGVDIYVYNRKRCKYSQISLEHFAKAVKKGVVLYNCKVSGLGRKLKELER